MNLVAIDIAKFVFSCLIPFFHITFAPSLGIDILRQYFARLGVPFFFAVTGFFLAKSAKERGAREALIRIEKRTGKLLLVWLLLYLPLLFPSLRVDPHPMRCLLFQTPAYLWYLSAVCFAAVPFCMVNNRKLLWILSAGLYIVGTLLGETYAWLTGGMPDLYLRCFLTTRNGLFFALFFLCVGEMVYTGRRNVIEKAIAFPLMLSLLALFIEMTIVWQYIPATADRSMYLTLPVFTYNLVRLLCSINMQGNTGFLRRCSEAIYVTQFGIICVMEQLFSCADLKYNAWVVYLAVIAFPMVVCYFDRKKKVLSLIY